MMGGAAVGKDQLPESTGRCSVLQNRGAISSTALSAETCPYLWSLRGYRRTHQKAIFSDGAPTLARATARAHYRTKFCPEVWKDPSQFTPREGPGVHEQVPDEYLPQRRLTLKKETAGWLAGSRWPTILPETC